MESKYLGIHTQILRNNQRTILMLVLFPVLVAVLVWVFFFLLIGFALSDEGGFFSAENFQTTSFLTLQTLPWVIGFCLIWFVIAYFINVKIIKRATHSHTLDRSDNKRVYNLVENLCMAAGMPMPKVNVIEDESLNAFASGINEKTYTVTLTRGIIDKLDDEELEGVIAHELTHIRNRDVRMLIVSIVFVGIFSTLATIMLRSLSLRGKKNIVIILIVLAVVALGKLLSSLMRFAISRNREYMADAGAAEMTKKPQALASALRKISGNAQVESVTNNAVTQLFIENALDGKKSSLFASHPPILKRIEVLEQF